MEQFRNIGIIGRMNSVKVVETLRHLRTYLINENYQVILESDTATMLPGHGLQVSSKKLLGEICDLVIVVGGDGSLLGAARELAKSKIPILGVNRGRLGFLTDISPDDLEDRVGRVLQGEYIEEHRFLLDAHVTRDDNPLGFGTALNDVVLHPGKSTRMIGFDLYIDGHFVYSQRSDGLIVSTPTGSTAYSLSAGGPIMHPKLDAVVLVPMFPHTLSSRPIVVDGKSEIKLVIGESNETYPQVSCDGQMDIACAPGDVIRITKKPFKIRLIHPTDHNFYATCREKLGWASNIAAS
ncbi:MAG: NAD(+) kinase [Alteromonadaceae bacterium]|uniref:NAD(+) kinase n=1 Tax=unclassified Marinobacter TaxID=83889 RepID=UPI000C512E8C|nr:NAD(+) kinase [Marinobacter sp. BGYM27]MAA64285.1 NAD(+) kinase [Alteromonadaceae bacterium]MBH84310.1 NAD(+) kinase [Alteromonadaceae bacterium]MDG5498498.1 NAD(+) kinase [Marinobacter sp. BGYM27]|tara:strand:+ start:18783 stop:19667 length:885 start_codon:yes stop_codon:yes gene_type:complete